MAGVLNIVGVTLEAVGLVIAALGGWQTWRDFAPTDEGLWDPAVGTFRRVLKRVVEFTERGIRRLLGKPKAIELHAGVVRGSALVSGNLTVRKGYGPLTANTAEALRQLDDRTREILKKVYDERDAVDQRLRDLRSELEEVSKRLDEPVDTMGAQTRRVAIGGIRLQLVGLAFVGVGLVFQLIASLPLVD
jgi:hypothetical protein